MVAFKSAIMRRVAGGSKYVILLVVKHEAGVDWAGMWKQGHLWYLWPAIDTWHDQQGCNRKLSLKLLHRWTQTSRHSPQLWEQYFIRKQFWRLSNVRGGWSRWMTRILEGQRDSQQGNILVKWGGLTKVLTQCERWMITVDDTQTRTASLTMWQKAKIWLITVLTLLLCQRNCNVTLYLGPERPLLILQHWHWPATTLLKPTVMHQSAFVMLKIEACSMSGGGMKKKQLDTFCVINIGQGRCFLQCI